MTLVPSSIYRHTPLSFSFFFFFFNDTATTEIYTLSLHDALPIFASIGTQITDAFAGLDRIRELRSQPTEVEGDRKSTRLNSSHLVISYAVFCLKKKKVTMHQHSWHSLSGVQRVDPPLVLCDRCAI